MPMLTVFAGVLPSDGVNVWVPSESPTPEYTGALLVLPAFRFDPLTGSQ